MSERPAVVLLAGPSSYRLAAFVRAASALDFDVVRAVDTPAGLRSRSDTTLAIPFDQPDVARDRILDFLATRPHATVLGVDDAAVELAASVNRATGHAHNVPGSDLASRDKAVMRRLFAEAGLPGPDRRELRLDDDPAHMAAQLCFPVVVKPTRLNGSRGVIRANDAAEFVAAFVRTRNMLLAEGFAADDLAMVAEAFIPGTEVAVESLLTDGELTVLAIFDKPDPLDGPFFEETIYVTPSRLGDDIQRAILDMTGRMAAALGIRHGPVHAELRINDDGVWPIEVAGRSIGGMCATILEFGAGMSLEEIILRHSVGYEIQSLERTGLAAGVMMIPIPQAGILRGVGGIEEAGQVPGITGVEITAPLNQPLVPLPEGASYLGFIFARAADPHAVETALREAHAALVFEVAPMVPLTLVSQS